MDSSHVKYVLVGGGGAGSAAAVAIRKLDPFGSVLLVGQENNRPYRRPALSKEYLRREKSRRDIAAEPDGWYVEKNISLRTSQRVTNLDTARRAIMLNNGEEISFDKLLLATGASSEALRVEGSQLPNVFYLRTIDDCDRLHHAIDSSPRKKAAVVGSGLLAVEVAASLKQMGLHVELLAEREYPWAKIAGPSTGQFITPFLQQHGVVVHGNVGVERLEGDGRVQRIIGSRELTVECDFVVVAIGIVSNRELLRGTPIAAEKAILVDTHCRTNLEGIYAAGDCAAIFDPLFGKHRVIDHWDSARVMGTIAGTNMAGGERQYDSANTFNSEIFDLKLHGWGEARFVDRRLVRGNLKLETPDFAEIGVAADGRVAQVLAIGRTSEHELFAELVQRRFKVDGVEELLKDPAKDLNELLR